MVQHTLSHTVVLEVSADDIWEVSKQLDEILPALEPEYFTKSTFIEGFPGEPGSIRLVKPGPAVPHAGEWKERLDFLDEESKSSRFTIIGGDPRYNNVTSVIKCVATGKSSTEVTWTCTYEPVGDAPAPEHMKEGVVQVLKTLEKAVKSRQTLTHTETFDASPDAVWKAVHNLDNIVPKYLPDVFESATNISGQYYGKPGGIRIVKFGPAVPTAGEVWERLDFSDDATKTMGVSLLKGDPRYPYLKTIKVVGPGAVEGTADAVWTVTYIAAGNAGPPESHKHMYMQVCKVIGAELKANPEAYA
ncbi:unnamed protein product [Sphagnum troendelagicum]|uniref:Bet v I/Major latex protein domain-containing protein n=1 Tax=Sphagnum troendelagicum TaxID=128251 RepID=A0ABP0TSC3_9BRYO